MKKLLLLLTLCITSTLAFAQDFGKTLITGSISYSTNKSENGSSSFDQKTTRFKVNPKAGFFISPRVAVGLSAGFESYSSPHNAGVLINGEYQTMTLDNKTYLFNAGPFVRVYQTISNKAAFFGQANAYYSYGKSDYEGTPNSVDLSSTSKGGGVNLSPGFVFFPTDIIGLELSMGSIGYSQSKSGTDSDYKSKSFDLDLGISSVSLGISLYLGRTAGE